MASEDLQKDLNESEENAARAAKTIYDISNDIKNQAVKTGAETAAAAKAGKDVAETGKDVANAAGKAMEAGSTAAEAGAGAGAGTAAGGGAAVAESSNPAGWIVAATSAAYHIGKKLGDVSLDPDGEEESSTVNIFFLILLVIIFFFFGGTLIDMGVTSELSVSQETEFIEQKINGEHLAQAGEQFKLDSRDVKDFNDEKPLQNGIMNYIYGYDSSGTEGLRSALSKAIREHCQNIVLKLQTKSRDLRVKGKQYDSERSLHEFYQNRWPYDLATDTFEPKIGNVLIPDQDFYGVHYDPWNPRYDDVNYVEILSVLAMSEDVEGTDYGLVWGNVNFEDFNDYLLTEDCYRLLYELGLKWVPIYVGEVEHTINIYDGAGNIKDTETYTETVEYPGDEYDSPEECEQADQTRVFDGVTCEFQKYFIKPIVKPFGLRELFALAFGSDDPMLPYQHSKAYEENYEFFMHNNIGILDYQERVTRLYQRDFKVNFKVNNKVVGTADALGPSVFEERSEHSPIYKELLEDDWLIDQGVNGTGRSAWYYVFNTYNDDFSEIWGGTLDAYNGNLDPNKLLEMLKNQNIDMDEFLKWLESLPEDAVMTNTQLYYICQGWAEIKGYMRGNSGETIGQSGCCDTSYMMIMQSLLGVKLSTQDIIDISGKYVLDNAMFDRQRFINDFGIKETRANTAYAGNESVIQSELNAGRPVVLHIRGRWEVDGTVYHKSSNGHFLTITGYDQNGFYVCDPGSTANTNNGPIPYEAFYKGGVGDVYFRTYELK